MEDPRTKFRAKEDPRLVDIYNYGNQTQYGRLSDVVEIGVVHVPEREGDAERARESDRALDALHREVMEGVEKPSSEAPDI